MDQAGVPLFCAASAAQGLDLPALLREVVESQRYMLGPRVHAFEEAFAAYVGVPHAIGVANGTDALEIALRGLGIGPGQRVLTVANAGFYVSTATRAVGAEPVYAEVDADIKLVQAHSILFNPRLYCQVSKKSAPYFV